MKIILNLLIVLVFIRHINASTLTFEMIKGFSSEDSENINDEPDLIVHSENEKVIIISVKGYFYNLKNKDLFHDGQSRKLFLLNKENNEVIDSYPYALGYLNSFIEKDNYYFVTDLISQGGSGGSEMFGNLKVLTVKDGKLKALFDEQVAYQDNGATNTSEFDQSVAIAYEKHSLMININDSQNSCPQVPFGQIGSDPFGIFYFVTSECLMSNGSTILFDLQKGDNNESLRKIWDYFRK